MANSTTNLDLISASQANKEVTANALMDAASPAILYGRRASTSAALTFGYYGGTVSIAGTPTQIANGTVTLAASTTNYIEADPATGAVSVNQSGFTSGHMALYSVVTGTATVTSYTDLRVLGGGGSVSGVVKSVNTKTPDGAGAVTLTASDVGADASGAAASAVSAHVAASDPHTQYALESTIGQANGIAALGSDGKVPSAQLPASATTGGTVTSVGMSVPGALLSVSGSPVTGSGTLAVSLIAQAVNTVFAGPSSGGSAVPSFRSLTTADLPVMVGSGSSHAAGIVPDPGSTAGTARYLREDGTWAAPPGSASGTVTSVDLAVPGVLYTVSGGPVTGSGTLTFSLKTQAKNTFLAGPTTGADATPTMRALVAADLPAQPFDITAFYPGVPASSVIITRVPLARAVSFLSNFSGSIGTSGATASASTAFDIRKNGTSIGAITFANGAATATFTTSSGFGVSFAAGDVISIHAPGTPDATLANVGFVLAGTR